MPSSMTHTYFGLDVYSELPNNCQKKIQHKLEYFKLFCQGSDPFMFYHFLIGKKSKEVSNIQTKMHRCHTRKFFISTIEYIFNHQLINNEEVMSYLYGYICHYYLDCYTHPYIYYKSGIFRKEDPSTYCYNGLHQEIEYMIDLYFISQREEVPPEKFKVYQQIFDVNSFSVPLQNIIQATIEEIYQIENAPSLYLKSIWYMKKFFQYVNYDPHGLKQHFYHFIDCISPSSMIQLEELSYHCSYKDKLNYLNLEHQIWNYPWDKNQTSTNSFMDLYKQSKKEATQTIQEITNMLEEEKLDQKKLKKTFKNLSFSTGRKCGEKLDMKYFEF